jgi:hypothetical protein
MNDANKTLKRANLFYRWSPLLFAIALLWLLLSMRYQSLTLDYSIRALGIGLFSSVLVVNYWKRELKGPGGPTLVLLCIVLVVGGFFWSSSQAFGVSHAGQSLSLLASQFFSIVSSVFFAVLVTQIRSLP